MDTIIGILEWLFFKTIYGIAIIGLIVFAIFWAVKRIFPSAPNPGAMAVLIGLIALFTLPSVPRYLFERNVLAQIDGKPWLRVTNQTQWGDIVEPLTLIWTPVGSVTVVMPNDPITGGFREIVMQYDEEPVITMVDAYCEDFTISHAQPDDEGTFRLMSRTPQEMTDEQREIYCEHDWEPEREALRSEMLRQLNTEDK